MTEHVPAWWDEIPIGEGTLELRVRAVAGGVRVVADGVGQLDVVLPTDVARQLAEALRLAAGDPAGLPVGDPVATTPAGSAFAGPPPPPDDRAPRSGGPVVPGEHTAPSVPGGPSAPGGPSGLRDRSLGAPTAWSDAPPPPAAAAEALDRLLVHVRRLSRVLPETAEIDTLGDPTFRVSTRIFAVVETVDDVPVLRFKATLEEQAELLDDARYRADPDTGHHGWTSLRADRVEHPGELDRVLLSSYRLVAPADAVVRLDEALGSATDVGVPGAVPADGDGA